MVARGGDLGRGRGGKLVGWPCAVYVVSIGSGGGGDGVLVALKTDGQCWCDSGG